MWPEQVRHHVYESVVEEIVRHSAFRIGGVVVRLLNTFEGIWRYFGIDRILIGTLMREGLS
jgi:hypothetical protein